MDFIPKNELYGFKGYTKATLIRRIAFATFFMALIASSLLAYQYNSNTKTVEAIKRDLAMAQLEESKEPKQELDYGVWPELSNTEFFNQTKQTYIENGVDFIEVNLSDMSLRVHKDGKRA